jgi:hypothetical protein
MVYSLILGAIALLGGGWFTSSLVSSLAEPVALILAAASGIIFFVEVVRNEYLQDLGQSESGEGITSGILGIGVFYLVFIASQSIITSLSPLAGVIVVGLGVWVFIMGPGILFELADLFKGDS